MTDYAVYSPGEKERIRYYLTACPLLMLLGLLFYRHIAAAAVCAALAVPLERFYRQHMAHERRQRLLEGFRDALYTISASVAAGRSMPAALEDAAMQSEASYGVEADITGELRSIVDSYRSVHGDPAELLTDLGKRSGLAEIALFASSYAICRLCGGDLEDVCLKSASLLLDKLAFRSETDSLMAQKKLDILLLLSLPLLMLVFLNLTAFSYIAVLYTSAAGRLLMSMCLAAIGGALYWSIRIIDVEL
ncbi:MAG: type II secretion system F family protein [Firmicutes bacterium]|nr:type II secretion system F family protein [Bacillota bacterium]